MDALLPRIPWMQGQRKVHPLLIDLIPEVPPSQLAAMIDQARRTGRIAGAITVWRDHLVDGRARVRCADKTGLPVEENDISAMQEASLPDVLLEMNLYRRHLTSAQRALAAIETSQRAARLGLKHITKERAAATSGISASSLHALQYALTIVPPLIQPIRAGIISINRATEACRAMIDWPASAQAELVATLMQGDSAEAARIIRSLRPRPPAAATQKRGSVVSSTLDPAVGSGCPTELDHADDTASPLPAGIANGAAAARDPIPVMSGDGAAPYGPLLAALREIARLQGVLRELSALVRNQSLPENLMAELAAAIRPCRALDWAALQRDLDAIAATLARHDAQPPTICTETPHGS